MTITKEQLKEFLKGEWDVTFDQITKDFRIAEDNFPKVKMFLGELEKEGWIRKSFCQEHKTEEFDPSEGQGY